MSAALDLFLGEGGKEAFDKIEPRSTGGCEGGNGAIAVGAIGARGNWCQGRQLVPGAIGARHDQGSTKASIRKSEQGQGSRKAVRAARAATKLSHRVTERYGAGF